MRSDTDRINKYTAKVAPTTVGLKVASRLTGMKSGFADMMDELVPIEQQIQGILNGTSTPTLHYPFYLSFGRELWKMEKNGIAGAAALARAQALTDKWEEFGCTAATLITIAADVFGHVVT